MTAGRDAQSDPDRPVTYQIRLKGTLGPQWQAWFGEVTITTDTRGDTLITGPVADQAALHGLLKKVRDLGLTLLSVTATRGNAPSPPPDKP
jgi:hypothetical protein